MWLPKDFIIKESIKLEFNLNKTILRESCSKKASNSFVKSKKKMEIKESYDPMISKKSMFHSLRILDFANQIAERGFIYNYEESNKYWIRILNTSKWVELKSEFQSIYNEKKIKLRLLCPKK